MRLVGHVTLLLWKQIVTDLIKLLLRVIICNAYLMSWFTILTSHNGFRGGIVRASGLVMELNH